MMESCRQTERLQCPPQMPDMSSSAHLQRLSG